MLVSVLLPVYNSENTISSAIESVLNQSMTDFELLIINDGSTDCTLDIIHSYSDSRIVRVVNDVNMGLIYSLNRGISLSKGKYIARMDSDDIMDVDRLLIQCNYLETHFNIDLCGSSCYLFNDLGIVGKQMYFTSYDEIKAELLFNCPICHPSVLLKKDVFMNIKYDEKYLYAEDYFLWTEVLSSFRAYNIPRFLMKYRCSMDSQTANGEKNKEKRYEVITYIQNKVLREKMNLCNDSYHTILHYNLSLSERIKRMPIKEFPIHEIKKYFNCLLRCNKKEKYVGGFSLQMILGKIWIKVFVIKHKEFTCLQLWSALFSKFSFYGLFFLIKRTVVFNNFFK